MPQITYIPSQNVSSEIGQKAFERLFDNLAANVKYREDRQALKNAEAQKMSMKMALGLVPKSNDMVFTDNGQEFTKPEAQAAYYEALSGKMGDQPMDREGYTKSRVDGIEESKALQQQQINQSTTKDEEQFAQEVRNAARRGIRTTETLRETDPTLITRGNEAPNANVYAPERDMNKQAELAKSVFTNVLGLSASAAQQLAQKVTSPQQSTASAPAPASTVAAGKPADKPQNTRTSASAKVDVSDAVRVSERDQSSVKIKTPDVTIKNPIVGTTTMDRQSARIDDLKTSYWNLLGLKAAEDAAGSFAVYDNPQYGVANKGTFDIALQRRQDQINNWEKAASEDGMTQKAEQFGTQEYSKTGTDLDLSQTRANALANRTEIRVGGAVLNATNGDGDGGKNAMSQLVAGSTGQQISGGYNPNTNDFDFNYATVPGVEMSKWVQQGVKTESIGNGRLRWTLLKGGKPTKYYLEGEPVGGNANNAQAWQNVTGTMPNGIASSIFMTQGVNNVGRAARNTFEETARASALQETEARINAIKKASR